MTARRRLARASVTAAAALSLVLGLTAVTTTTAAWTDSTNFRGSAAAGTWGTEEPTGPLEPGPDTILSDTVWTITDPNQEYCFETTVSTTSTTPVRWSVLAHLDQAPFWGASAWQLFYRTSSQGPIQASATDAGAGLAAVRGPWSAANSWNAQWNNGMITAGTSLRIRMCNAQPAVAPVADASWYSVTTTPGTQWDARRACVNVTVTGNRDAAAYPFFYGWTGTLDLTGVKQFITANGGRVNNLELQPWPSSGFQFDLSPATTSPVADVYTITSGRMTALQGSAPRSIVACVNGNG